MNEFNSEQNIKFKKAQGHCPAGEAFGNRMMEKGKFPVISCEGFCIRGEIARVAANMLSREGKYGRACHGEILSVPDSAMAKWARQSEQIIVIDGCFLHCHGRMMLGLFSREQLAVFDALGYYGKYTDKMEPDEVPESERLEVARIVYKSVLNSLEKDSTKLSDSPCKQEFCQDEDILPKSGCCSC